ncbi:MAG TPA: exonuclease domain-containing protein [Solirubrobacteraceae bacterium]|nr:exonuclease domain-containing protein [Solirubrobacteraceae bacterium]
MDLLAQPLATTEFIVVDTETNGRAGDACELTEIGAVLVGGGELHDRWETLVGGVAPLSRSIQRFTQISQAMVDEAPAADAILPDLAELIGSPPLRVLVAHNAAFDRRVLRQAFARTGLAWPDPPTLCTVALARRFAPLVRQRRLAALADSLGIEVHTTHRALADAETCARVFCALFGRLCANAGTVGDAIETLKAPRRPRAPRARRTVEGGVIKRHVPDTLDFRALPDEPGVYLFRNAVGQVLYVGKSVALRTRARAHFHSAARADGWTAQAALVDHRTTNSELGALVLENRLIRELRPPGNLVHKHDDTFVYLRCRLDIAYPVIEVAREPASGRSVTIGPLRSRAAAVELKEQLDSLFGLRHCGRKLRLRPWPSAYGQMGRCMSPCLNDLDPNLYRRKLDEALALFGGSGDGGAALLAHMDEQMRAASADQRYERAAWLRRRRERIAALVRALDGNLQATHTRPRLVLAPHPRDERRGDAFWLAEGRVVDWGPPTSGTEDLLERTRRAVARRIETTADMPAAAIAEARIVQTWLASHEAPALELDPLPEPAALRAFLSR